MSRRRLIVDLEDGRTLVVPLALIDGFESLPRKAFAGCELMSGGIGIHFPAIDEDVNVENLLHPELTLRRRTPPRLVAPPTTKRQRRVAGR